MIRVVLENLLLFLTPAFLYFIYALVTANSTGTPEDETSTAGSPAGILQSAPYGWLFLAGIGVVAVVLILFSSSDGGKPGQQYAPPTMKDGKIVPGHME
jgi:hypothetical protein